MTRAYRDIWAAHIPQEQHVSFLDGGYFHKEVIPGDLSVLSLNTLYWYDANAATRGCKRKDEPGSIHLVRAFGIRRAQTIPLTKPSV